MIIYQTILYAHSLGSSIKRRHNHNNKRNHNDNNLLLSQAQALSQAQPHQHQQQPQQRPQQLPQPQPQLQSQPQPQAQPRALPPFFFCRTTDFRAPRPTVLNILGAGTTHAEPWDKSDFQRHLDCINHNLKPLFMAVVGVTSEGDGKKYLVLVGFGLLSRRPLCCPKWPSSRPVRLSMWLSLAPSHMYTQCHPRDPLQTNTSADAVAKETMPRGQTVDTIAFFQKLVRLAGKFS